MIESLYSKKNYQGQLEVKAIESKWILIQKSKQLDKKINDLNKEVDQKSLEVQIYQTDITSFTEGNISQESQYFKLNNRSKKLDIKLSEIKNENIFSKDIIKDLNGSLRQIQLQNSKRASELDSETIKRDKLVEIILKTKNEINSLKQSTITESNRVVHAKNKRIDLEAELFTLQKEKKRYF